MVGTVWIDDFASYTLDMGVGDNPTAWTPITHRRELATVLGRKVTLLPASPGVLAFAREPGFACVLNCGSRHARLPEVGELLVTSSHDSAVDAGMIEPDTAAWFAAT